MLFGFLNVRGHLAGSCEGEPRIRAMRFSSRVKVGEPNAVTRAERAAEACGVRLTRLADSNPTRHGLGVPDLPEYQASPRGPLATRETLANFLGERDGREVDPERLYLLSSTSQAYSWLMKLFCDPGDWVAAPTPGYPLVAEIARLEAVNVTYYPLEWVGRWEMNLDGLARFGSPLHEVPSGIPANFPATSLPNSRGAGAVIAASATGVNQPRPQPHPAAIIAINPNNPTGSYVQDFEREHLVEFAAANQVPLIADEVFFDFWLDESPATHEPARESEAAHSRLAPHEPDVLSGRETLGEGAPGSGQGEPTVATGGGEVGHPLMNPNPESPRGTATPIVAPARRRLAGETRALTFALDGLSKNLAAPGAKVAWIEVSGSGELVAEAQARLDVIADAYLPFSDCLAARLPEWLAAIPAQVARVRGRCQENLACLQELVAGEPTGTVTVLSPEGGWNALLRFPAVVDEDSLVASLIDGHGVAVQPGYFFDMPFAGVVSVSLLLEPGVFAVGISALLAQYREMLS